MNIEHTQYSSVNSADKELEELLESIRKARGKPSHAWDEINYRQEILGQIPIKLGTYERK